MKINYGTNGNYWPYSLGIDFFTHFSVKTYHVKDKKNYLNVNIIIFNYIFIKHLKTVNTFRYKLYLADNCHSPIYTYYYGVLKGFR